MASLFEKIILAIVSLTVAGYMFGPAIQGWVTANTTGSVSLTWLTLSVMPIIICVVILLLALNFVNKKK